jgi:hypothetical protein
MSVNILIPCAIFLGAVLTAEGRKKGLGGDQHPEFRRQGFRRDRGPELKQVHLKETFTGDIDGESEAQALGVAAEDGSASLISLQRVRGRAEGRRGTFVLQGSETVQNGKIKATWFVVPGSGTGELRGGERLRFRMRPTLREPAAPAKVIQQRFCRPF